MFKSSIVFTLAFCPIVAAALERGDAHRIEANFVAPCCWRQNLAVHDSPEAYEMRAEIAKFVASGRTEAEIVNYYVAHYGERILREPRGQRWFWLTLTPIAAIALAGLWVVRYLSQVKRTDHGHARLAAFSPMEEEDLQWPAN
jgi:cytochrome c-type biogenesis protein CcmH/NrfF